jgi:hypothetical protein
LLADLLHYEKQLAKPDVRSVFIERCPETDLPKLLPLLEEHALPSKQELTAFFKRAVTEHVRQDLKLLIMLYNVDDINELVKRFRFV